MPFESIILNLLTGESIAKLLTAYGNEPAVFYQFVPSDVSTAWRNEKQFPRICFYYDMQANQERKSSGTLNVSVYCKNSADEIIPEVVSSQVKECLRDIIIRPDRTYGLSWANTAPFDMEDNIIGEDILFDIIEYPGQITTDPDPIDAMNEYISQIIPDAIIIGRDPLENVTRSSVLRPLIYCRLESVETDRVSHTVAWMNARIAIHIFCPDPEVRKKIIMAIAIRLSVDGEVIMVDKSPMIINRLQVDFNSDYLTTGQLFATTNYGIVRYKDKKKALNPVAGTTY